VVDRPREKLNREKEKVNVSRSTDIFLIVIFGFITKAVFMLIRNDTHRASRIVALEFGRKTEISRSANVNIQLI